MESRFPEWIDYTKKILRHVRFKFDHEAIRDEYLEHMDDMYEFYLGRGMSADQAKSAVLDDMGDADELGCILNQIHNPVLGWIWRLSRWITAVLVAVFIYTCGNHVWDGIFNGMEWLRTHGDLLYTVELDEKEVLDYRTLHFTKLEVYEYGTAVLYYTDFIRLADPFEAGLIYWNHAEINDKHGPIDESMKHGNSQWGWIRKFAVEFGNVMNDSEYIFIDYDWNQCQFTLEIPLLETDDMERGLAE